MQNGTTRPWALVTGASAGIGEAFARELAARGHCVVVTARRRERLEALKAELEREAGVRVEVIAADLSDPAAPQQIFEELARRDIAIDLLVNNAGYGVAKPYVETRWNEQADFLQVMITAVAHLTHMALPGMITRGSGTIINVASLAGLIHGAPRSTLYAASKAFMIKLTESLSLELDGTGVTVSAVCPGLTTSEFHDRDGTRDRMGEVPRGMWMDARSVAREALDAARRGKVVHVNGRMNQLIATFVGRLPRTWAHGLLKLQSQLEARGAPAASQGGGEDRAA